MNMLRRLTRPWAVWIIVSGLLLGCTAPTNEAEESASVDAPAAEAAPTPQPISPFTVEQGGRISNLQYNPDSSTALVSGFPVRVVELATGDILREFAPQTYMAAFGADGSQIITAELLEFDTKGANLQQQEIAVWDGAEAVQRFNITSEPLLSIALSPDGTLAAGVDWAESHVIIWDAATGDERARYVNDGDEAGLLYRLSFSADSVYLFAEAFVASESVLLNASTGERVGDWDMDAFFDPVTQSIKLPAYYFDVYNANAGGFEVELFPAEPLENAAQLRVSYAALSPGGGTIVTLTEATGVAHVIAWDRETGQERWRAQTSRLAEVSFSADGSRVMGNSFDCEFDCASFPDEVIVWDVATGEELLHLESTMRLFHAAISPDGTNVAIGVEREARFVPVDEAYSTTIN